MNLTFVKEEGYLIVGREGRLAAALLKNASRHLNKELVFNISARNLEIEFILSKILPSQTLNIIWSSGWAGARSDKETCNEDFKLFSLFIDRLFNLKCNHLNFIFLSSGNVHPRWQVFRNSRLLLLLLLLYPAVSQLSTRRPPPPPVRVRATQHELYRDQQAQVAPACQRRSCQRLG